MTVFRLALFVLVGTLTSWTPPVDNPDALLGRWLSSQKRNQVQIFKQGNRYYGRLVWMAEPLDTATKLPKVDSKNPDHKLRHRPLLNLTMMTDLVYKGGNVWSDGRVYNPEDGKTYSCELTLKDPNTLDLRGYVLGMPFLGRSRTWTRVR